MPCGATNCFRLCGPIARHLRPYTEGKVVLVTEEIEKDILVALSQVFNEIQSWIQEIDGPFDDRMVEKITHNNESTSSSYPNLDDHRCMMKIVADLVALIAINSPYIQHLAGNVLVIFSEFVAVTGRNWDIFVQLLPSCMALVMTTKILTPSVSTVTVIEDALDLAKFYDVLKHKMEKVNLSTVACFVLVLRNQLKSLKKRDSNDLIGVFIHYLNFHLSKVSWTLCDEIFVGESSDTTKIYCSSNADGLCHSNVRRLIEPRIVFLGNFVQLLCSLVDQRTSWEAEASSLNLNSACIEIIDLVPSLFKWCHDKQRVDMDTCLRQYFRHKLLVLMIRLSFRSPLWCSTLTLWLELLHTYLDKLVWQQMTSIQSGQDECIEDSPFLLTVIDIEAGNLHSIHLQRLFIFLFLKCSFSLIMGKNCSFTIPKSHSSSDTNLTVKYDGHGCDCREKGLVQLFEWIQRQFPVDMFVEHEMYPENCIQFTSSFLQLYISEDDLLFKVLLELLKVPFYGQPRLHEELKYHNEKEDIIFHISNLFNPINLFHIFLAELHYDHQVLLDYLISKDAGISCLEYMIRCLRIISNSFHIFLEFPMNLNGVNLSSLKKRKVLSNNTVMPISLEISDRLIAPSKKNKETLGSDPQKYTTMRKPFKEAAKCLSLLKESVENLHKKNIFAYNPQVLLKRLTTFIELCEEEILFPNN